MPTVKRLARSGTMKARIVPSLHGAGEPASREALPPCVMGKKSNLADGDKALRSKQLLRNDASEGAEFTDDGYASLLMI